MPGMSTARNHLLVTRALALKGTVESVVGRLSDHLRSSGRATATVLDAHATWMEDGSQQELPQVFVSLQQVLFAHEYVDMSGDPHLQAMNAPRVKQRYRVVVDGAPGLVLLGSMTPPHVEASPFIVLDAPEWDGEWANRLENAGTLSNLPYLLINQSRIEAYYPI